MGKVKGFFTIILVIAVVIIGIWALKDKSNDINTVKRTPVLYDESTTYGKVLEAYCSGTKWKQFTSQGYDTVVEFTGKSPQGKVLIQFVRSLARDEFEIGYIELNNRQIAEMDAVNFIMSAVYSG